MRGSGRLVSALLVGALGALSACGAPRGAPDGGGTAPGAGDAGASDAVDAGTSDVGAVDAGAVDAGPSWDALEALLRDKVGSGAISGYAVQIYDRDDALLFESEAGICRSPQGACPSGNQPFTVDLVTGVASSSKWVTSTVLLAALDELVAAGTIPSVAAGLDTTVGAVLSETCGAARLGRGATVTLRQLLSFTSGLLPDHACVGANGSAVQPCACAILSDSAAAEVARPGAGSAANHAQPPGSVWKYGGAQQVVAAAMLEVATRTPFATLFERRVRAPTGMTGSYRDATNLSGSLRTSVRDYARFVRGLYHAGAPGTLLSAAALEEQERNQLPVDVLRRSALQPGLDYGLNTWRWCYRALEPELLLRLGRTPEAFTPQDLLGIQDASCAAVHQQGHGGKGGYQPFVDRRRGLYGVFAMREPSPGAGDDYELGELALTAVVRLYAGQVVEAERSR